MAADSGGRCHFHFPQEACSGQQCPAAPHECRNKAFKPACLGLFGSAQLTGLRRDLELADADLPLLSGE